MFRIKYSNGMVTIHSKVVINTPNEANKVSAPYFCENSVIVGAAGIPDTRMAVISNENGTDIKANGSNKKGMNNSLAIAIFHKYLFLIDRKRSL